MCGSGSYVQFWLSKGKMSSKIKGGGKKKIRGEEALWVGGG